MLIYLLMNFELKVYLMNTCVGDKLINDRTRELLHEAPDNTGYTPPLRLSQVAKRSDFETYSLITHSFTISKCM